MNLKQLICKHRLWTFPSLVDPPQINSYADAGERTLGAKIPTPFFFMSAAFFLPVADCAFLPAFFFSAFSVAFVACDM